MLVTFQHVVLCGDWVGAERGIQTAIPGVWASAVLLGRVNTAFIVLATVLSVRSLLGAVGPAKDASCGVFVSAFRAIGRRFCREVPLLTAWMYLFLRVAPHAPLRPHLGFVNVWYNKRVTQCSEYGSAAVDTIASSRAQAVVEAAQRLKKSESLTTASVQASYDLDVRSLHDTVGDWRRVSMRAASFVGRDSHVREDHVEDASVASHMGLSTQAPTLDDPNSATTSHSSSAIQFVRNSLALTPPHSTPYSSCTNSPTQRCTWVAPPRPQCAGTLKYTKQSSGRWLAPCFALVCGCRV